MLDGVTPWRDRQQTIVQDQQTKGGVFKEGEWGCWFKPRGGGAPLHGVCNLFHYSMKKAGAYCVKHTEPQHS